MKEQLINFETAKLAEEKGFDLSKEYFQEVYITHPLNRSGRMYSYSFKEGDLLEPIEYRDYDGDCYVSYTDKNSVYAPTQSLLQKWLREEHNLHIYIDTTPTFGDMESHRSKYKALVKVPFQPFKWTTGKYYLGDTYEEALEKGLQEALKLI